MESGNQVLHQQALAVSPTSKALASPQRTTIIKDLSLSASNPLEPETKEKPQKSLDERQQKNKDLLMKCISQDLGFSGGRPIAACVIYKCLLHWRSFEDERTAVFDRVIQTIGLAIEAHDNNDASSYWLSNSSTLLLLLQHTILTPQRRRSTSTSLFGRMFQVKRPFKQQLTVLLEKTYGMIRDNLKKEISPLLGLCIQAPRTSCASLVKGLGSQADSVTQQALLAHWQSIVKILNNYLRTLRANYVPPFLVIKVFTQIFSFMNFQLFNSLLSQQQCCSFSNGEFVKTGLAELEQWCIDATEEYAGLAWDELKHIRQAVGFLVIHEKPKKTFNEITEDLCSVLNIQQLYRISTMYWDDKYGTSSVSTDVISSMRVMMTEESNNGDNSSFLLDDDSSIPFSVDDISKSMQQIDISNIDPPPLIREHSGFVFLLQRAE